MARLTDRVPNIVEFVTASQFLGLSISPTQETLLRAIEGLPLTTEQQEIWTRCTGRQTYPGKAFSQVTVIAGRRSGKDSRIAAPLALYEAFYGTRPRPVPKGDLPIIPLVAQNKKTTEIAFRLCREYVVGSPFLEQHLENELSSTLRLTDFWGEPVEVQCFACAPRAVRGWSMPAAIMDEVAFFRTDKDKPADRDMLDAIVAGGIMYPRQRLVKISTPWIQTGLIWEERQRFWGQEDAEVLVWHSTSVDMNPTPELVQRVAEERRLDPRRAAREFDAQFLTDIDGFLPSAWIDAAVVEGRHELPPREGVRIVAAVDPSGGAAKGDAFTLALVLVDLSDGAPLFQQAVSKGWQGSRTQDVDLDKVCGDIAAICKRYGVYRVTGDMYAGRWVEQHFRTHGILYVASEFDKSKAYRELEPWLAQGRLELVDHEPLLRELRLLERRYKPGGKTPTIDHPKGGHDDHANALALAVAELSLSLHPPIAMTAETARATAAREEAAERIDDRELELTGPRRGAMRLWNTGQRARVGMWRG